MLKTDTKTNLKKQLKTIKIILILYTGLCSAQCFNNDDEHFYKQLKIQYMDNLEKMATLLGVAEITEDYKSGVELEIGEWNTADGYTLHIITQNAKNIDFEYDVYYYEPSFDQIINRIKELNKDSIVYISDIEIYLPDSEIQDYINEHNEENNEE